MRPDKSIPALACAISLALGMAGYGVAAAPPSEPPSTTGAYTAEAAAEPSAAASSDGVAAATEVETTESQAVDESAESSRASLRPAYYTASDEDLLAAEAKYTSLEANLQFQLENYEIINPSYDEYVFEYDIDSIGHGCSPCYLHTRVAIGP